VFRPHHPVNGGHPVSGPIQNTPDGAGFRDGLVVMLTLSTARWTRFTFLRLGKVFSSVITATWHYSAWRRPARRHAGAQRRPGPGWLRRVVLLGSVFVGTRNRPAGLALRVTVTWPRNWPSSSRSLPMLASGIHRGTARRLALLLLAAAAMGMQSTAVRRLGQMSATHLTGTLTAVLTALATRRLPSDWQRSVGVLITIIIGAHWAPGRDAITILVPAAVIIPEATCPGLLAPRREVTHRRQPARRRVTP